MTLAQAAAQLGVGHDRLKKAATQGRLQATKLPGGLRMPYLVTVADVEAFLASDGARRGPKPKKRKARAVANPLPIAPPERSRTPAAAAAVPGGGSGAGGAPGGTGEA